MGKLPFDLVSRNQPTGDAGPGPADLGAASAILSDVGDDEALISGVGKMAQLAGGYIVSEFNRQKQMDITADNANAVARLKGVEDRRNTEITLLDPEGESYREKLEEINSRYNDEIDQFQNGVGDDGIHNLRYSESKDAFEQSRDLFAVRGQEFAQTEALRRSVVNTESKIQASLNEIVNYAGDDAEAMLDGLRDDMLDAGASADQVQVQIESTRRALSARRFERNLALVRQGSDELDDEALEAAFSAVESDLEDENGPYRNLNADDRIAAKDDVMSARRSAASNRAFMEAQAKNREAERLQAVDDELYKAMDQKSLTVENLDRLFYDKKSISREVHENWKSRLVKVEQARAKARDAQGDRATWMAFDDYASLISEMGEGEGRDQFVGQFEEQVRNSFKLGRITKAEFQEFQKVWKGGKGSSYHGVRDQETDLVMFVQRSRLNGVVGTDEFFERLDDGFANQVIGEEDYNKYVGYGLKARENRDTNVQSDAVSKSSKELERFYEELEALRGGEKNRRQLYFSVFTGEDEDFQKNRNLVTGFGLTNAGDEPAFVDHFRRVPVQPADWVGILNRVEEYVEENPGVQREDMEVFLQNLLVPVKLDAAKDEMRFQSGDYRVEAKREKEREFFSGDGSGIMIGGRN